MDYNEFEHQPSSINADQKYSKDVEFVVDQLDYIAHAAGRYSRSVQLPIAIHILNEIDKMRAKEILLNQTP